MKSQLKEENHLSNREQVFDSIDRIWYDGIRNPSNYFVATQTSLAAEEILASCVDNGDWRDEHSCTPCK